MHEVTITSVFMNSVPSMNSEITEEEGGTKEPKVRKITELEPELWIDQKIEKSRTFMMRDSDDASFNKATGMAAHHASTPPSKEQGQNKTLTN